MHIINNKENSKMDETIQQGAQAAIQQLKQAMAYQKEASNTGDPQAVEQAHMMVAQSAEQLRQFGIEPDDVVRQMQQEQAHQQGVDIGREEGVQQGTQQGIQQEQLRRGGSINPSPDVGVVTNSARDAVERLGQIK